MTSFGKNEIIIKNGKKYYGKAWMEKRGDLYVLHLNGTPYEVGYQHGVLMKEEIKKGVARIFADPINGGRRSYSLIKWIMKKYLNLKIFNPIVKAQPREILDQLKGIADGSGISYKTILRGNHQTAVFMVMMPVLFKSSNKKFEKLGIKIGACSTFVATKNATSNGLTIVGRNTDYSGIEGWPKYQTVLFVEPKEGLKYIQIGTAGVVMWAPGMNEKGIVVCAHYMIYDDIKPNGWSIAAFTDEILRKATNLTDAQNILNENPRGASCGFVVIDGKEKEAFAAELSTGKVIFRQIENNRISMTNMAVSEVQRKIDLVSKYLINEGCPGRYRRLMQLIDENYGKINPELAAEFMGDHMRYTTGNERNVYGIVGVADNVNSIIFSPEDLKLWIAKGKAPVCNNTYTGFDFKEEINGNRSQVIPNILKGYQFKNTNKRQGMEKYNQAYILFEKNPKKIQEILALVREASKLDPEEIIYYQIIAKILIQQGNYDEAMVSIEKALKYKMSMNERAHNHLILGIIFDLKNNRELALSNYSEVENSSKVKLNDPWFDINKVIIAFTKKYKMRPFNRKHLNDRCVLIDFAQSLGVE